MATIKTKAQLEEELLEKDSQLESQAKEVDLLKQQMEQMMQMMKQMQSVQPDAQPVQQPQVFNAKVKVVSLIENELNLTTEPYGNGRIFNFPKFGVEHRIRFDDLDAIVHTHRWIFEQGLAYICDRQAVQELGLEDEYEAIHDKKTIESIAKLETPQDVEMFLGLNDSMREKVCDMIVEDIVRGNERNYQYLYDIQRRCGIDIIKKSEDLKEIKK